MCMTELESYLAACCGVYIDNLLYKIASMRSLSTRLDSLDAAIVCQIASLNIGDGDINLCLLSEDLIWTSVVDKEAKTLCTQTSGRAR